MSDGEANNDGDTMLVLESMSATSQCLIPDHEGTAIAVRVPEVPRGVPTGGCDSAGEKTQVRIGSAARCATKDKVDVC
jgi:hypothetical protein